MVSSRLSPLLALLFGDVEVDDVGRQPLGRDLEGGAGARGVFEEEVEDAFAAQERHLLDLAVIDRQEGAGGVEDVRDHLTRQSFDGQQVHQLAVGIELGVALVQHGQAPPGAAGLVLGLVPIEKVKRPSSCRASDNRCSAGSTSLAAA